MIEPQFAMVRKHLPQLTESNRAFWQAGEQGRLLIARCQACGLYIQPRAAFCRGCHARDIRDEPVSGRATVSTFTINRHRWEAHLDRPFVIAIVTLVEQPGLNLMTNIVNCPIDEVAIGMPVQVIFEHVEDVWLPLFEPLHD